MLDETLARIALALETTGIPWMLIGGYAVAAHGVARMTQDIDLTVGVDIDRFDDVLHATAVAFDPLLDDPRGFAEKTNVLLLRDRENGIRVDLIFSFIPFEREAIQRAVLLPVGDRTIRVTRVEDLIVYKVLAGRERDLEDVRNLVECNRESLDIVFIENTLREMAAVLENDALAKWQAVRDDCL